MKIKFYKPKKKLPFLVFELEKNHTDVLFDILKQLNDLSKHYIIVENQIILKKDEISKIIVTD